MTIERDETTATKLAAVSERLEAREAVIACAHENAHRVGDKANELVEAVNDLRGRFTMLVDVVSDIDGVIDTALEELVQVTGKTAVELAELAKVTADEIAGERRKREELEGAVNALRAKVRSVAQLESAPDGEIRRLWRAIAETRSNRDDTHTLATGVAKELATERRKRAELESVLQLFVQDAREEATARKYRLDEQDEQILKLCRDVADIRAYQEETREGLDNALEAHDHGQPADAMDRNPTDGYARRDMIKWNQFQGEAITAQGERIRALEQAVAASQRATINGMDKLVRRVDGIETTAAALESHEHPEINFGEQVRQLDGSVYGMGQRIDGVERLAHRRMDNLATRLTELERRAR